MYIHSYSRVKESKEVFDFINTNGFAIMASTVEGKLWATHIPLVLSEDGMELSGHVSRGNKVWKDFTNNTEVLCIFQGPHAYVSSSWYNHENVPTWNYLAAHVYGNIQIVEGEELLESLKKLTNKYEKNSRRPVTVEGMTPKYLEHEMKGVVGFKIRVNRVEASFKLSQNRDDINYATIIDELGNTNHSDSIKIAEEMIKQRPHVTNMITCRLFL